MVPEFGDVSLQRRGDPDASACSNLDDFAARMIRPDRLEPRLDQDGSDEMGAGKLRQCRCDRRGPLIEPVSIEIEVEDAPDPCGAKEVIRADLAPQCNVVGTERSETAWCKWMGLEMPGLGAAIEQVDHATFRPAAQPPTGHGGPGVEE